jgi:hypothetical protein
VNTRKQDGQIGDIYVLFDPARLRVAPPEESTTLPSPPTADIAQGTKFAIMQLLRE